MSHEGGVLRHILRVHGTDNGNVELRVVVIEVILQWKQIVEVRISKGR
jgi:hypothetical protein